VDLVHCWIFRDNNKSVGLGV